MKIHKRHFLECYTEIKESCKERPIPSEGIQIPLSFCFDEQFETLSRGPISETITYPAFEEDP